MDNASIIAQLIVSISVISVWVFRYDNIVLEFKQYGISDLLRNIVGASKISLANYFNFRDLVYKASSGVVTSNGFFNDLCAVLPHQSKKPID